MKTKLTAILVTLVLFTACKKEEKKPEEPVTKPVEFTETAYEKLCSFNDTGLPDCLVAGDNISADLMNFVNNTLPQKKDLRTTNPALLSSTANADIAITQSSDVYITWVSQETALKNTFSYYTYPTANPPKSPKDITKIVHVFGNVGSNTPLRPGHKIKIGRFEPGTSIGFVLLADAWDATNKKVNDKAVHYCSNDVLNPEVAANLKKHTVLIPYQAENKILIGFEDLDRTTSGCDHDFNDVVLYATVEK